MVLSRVDDIGGVSSWDLLLLFLRQYDTMDVDEGGAVFVRLSLLSTREKEKGKKKDIHYVDLGAGNGAAAHGSANKTNTFDQVYQH
jgi:hypothetical protein